MKTRSHAGFTIVELLVVMTIMMSLMGLVISGARPSRNDGDVLRGAQQFAGILRSTQTLSLGSPTGAAVIIDSEGTFSTVASQARRYPFIEGTVVSGMPPANPAVAVQSVALKTLNDELSSLQHGYKIRFFDRSENGTDGPMSDWFEMTCTSGSQAVVRMREEYGQTPQTTIWPAASASGTLSFQAARYPIPTGLTQALPKGVAIDLRYSGYGDESMTNWGSLNGRGAIGVGFDAVGAVDALMQNVLPEEGQLRTVQPISPNEQIYFLVTLADEISDPNVNTLASERAVWVVIQPRTGRVTIAPNVPQKEANASAIRASRAKARQAVVLKS